MNRNSWCARYRLENFSMTYHCLESKFLSSLSSFSFFFRRWKLLLNREIHKHVHHLCSEWHDSPGNTFQSTHAIVTLSLLFHTSNTKENRPYKKCKEYMTLFLLSPSYISACASLFSWPCKCLLEDAVSFPNSYSEKWIKVLCRFLLKSFIKMCEKVVPHGKHFTKSNSSPDRDA